MLHHTRARASLIPKSAPRSAEPAVSQHSLQPYSANVQSTPHDVRSTLQHVRNTLRDDDDRSRRERTEPHHRDHPERGASRLRFTAAFWLPRSCGWTPILGAVPAPTDAISIELFQTEVIEAVAEAPSLASAASLASVEAEAGASHDAARAAAATDVAKPAPAVEMAAVEPPTPETAQRDTLKVSKFCRAQKKPPTQLDKSEARPAPSKEIDRPRKQQEPERREKDRPQKTAKLTDPDAIDKSDAKASKKGGAPFKANTGSAAAKARVSGSTGSADQLRGDGPRSRGCAEARRRRRRGTVVISFGVTSSGGLALRQHFSLLGRPQP